MKILKLKFKSPMSMLIQSMIALLLAFTSQSVAQTSAPAEVQANTSPWAHESELAIVTVDGNTASENYSGKQKTTYAWDQNSVVLTGRYLETTAEHVLTAKLWELSARYERSISQLWSLYLGHGAESDTFNGYIQRDNSDLGAKYQILESDTENWVAEAGYRYSHIYDTTRNNSYEDRGRLFTQYTRVLADNLSFKYWIEYLPSFDRPNRYFLNTEPSLNIMINKIFSLKTAYLVKYQNYLVPPNDEYVDTTFTTSLVAKF